MQRDDYRSTLIVMLGYSAATLTGFLRYVVIAQQLGVGRGTDIYLIAFALPEFIFIALPIVLNPAFIPLFTESRYRFGQASAWRLARNTAIGLSLLLILLSFTIALAAPLLLRWLAPGFSAAEHEIAVRSVRIMLPSLCLMGLATLSSAVLQVYRQFAPPALMTTVYNLVFAAVLLILPFASLIERASWGVTLGAAAALVLQIPILRRYYLRSSSAQPALVPKSSDVPIDANQVARLAIPLTAGYAVHHLILLIDRAMATTLAPGSVSALNYASHLALVIGQISGMAVSTVLFPRLAEQINARDFQGARTNLAEALNLIWLIALPASVGLIILRQPVINVLFERGAFDQLATAMVSAPLIWYSLAILADALCQPFWRLLYAQKSSWTVFGVNGLQTSIRILTNLILIHRMGYSGLALSAMIGLATQALVLGWLAYRRLGKYWSRAWLRSIRQTAFATFAAAMVISLLAFYYVSKPFLQVLIGGLLGTVTFLFMLQFPKTIRRIQRGIRTK